MRNIALIICPATVTEQSVLNNVPTGAEVSWHGSMIGKIVGRIRVPGSILYRGGFAPLLDTQLIMLRFSNDYSSAAIQTYLDKFGASPLILVAVWYGKWIKYLIDGEVVSFRRSWKVRSGLLASYAVPQIKNQLRNYFPEGDVIKRIAYWQGETYAGLEEGDDGWLEDVELA